MLEPTTLNVGFVTKNGFLDKVVEEMLNQQGVIFTRISTEEEQKRQLFPCVLLSSFEDEAYEQGVKQCVSEDNVVIVDREVPLGKIADALGGMEQSGDPTVPSVNEHEESLVKKLVGKYQLLGLPFIQKWFWPSFANACCVLTHDIDWLRYTPFHRTVFSGKPLPQYLRLALGSLFTRANYGDNVSSMVHAEEERRFKSSFYFKAEYESPRERSIFMNALNLLKKRGFEIGLHGFYAHKDVNTLKKQKEILENHVNSPLKGVRQHGLKFSVPATWRIEEEAGFSYDLTFHYNDCFGFRSRTCLPYHPVNLDEKRLFSVLEIPTCFIDYTVLHNRMSYSEALEKANALLKTVERFKGVFLTCFHNTYLNRETFPDICKLYDAILDYALKNKFWVMTGGECCDWWLMRERAEIKTRIKGRKANVEATSFPLPLIATLKDGVKKLDMTSRFSEVEIT